MKRWSSLWMMMGVVAGVVAGAMTVDMSVIGADPVVTESSEAGSDATAILSEVVRNRPRQNAILKGRLYPTRRADPVAVELLIKAEEQGTRTILRSGSLEWLIIQPDEGPVRWYKKGTGLLTVEQQTEPILGSQFSPYDMAAPYLRWGQSKLMGMERIKGRDCHLIEARSAEGPYRRVRLWVDRQQVGLLRAEAFNADDNLVKRFWVTSFMRLGEDWAPRGLEIAWRPAGQALPSEERSRMDLDDGRSGVVLDDALFDEKRFGLEKVVTP